MVRIPQKIKEFVEDQGVFVIGSSGGTNLINVSPRIFFSIGEEEIYWLDFFKHKSYKNFKINPWVTVAVFDKENLKGYQFRGTVSFIIDEPKKTEIRNSIIKETLERNFSKKVQPLSNQDAEIIQFQVKVCYSLDPEEYSDMSIGSDIDSTRIFE